MANVRKFNKMSDIGHLLKHYSRSVAHDNYSNKDIDRTKIHLDRMNLAPQRNVSDMEYLKNQIQCITKGKRLRKDAVKMCCWVVNLPKVSDINEYIFFEEVYYFLAQRYGKRSGMGEDVVISAYVHYSESTPHIHFAFMPVIQRNGEKVFCAKECINRKELSTIHNDLAEYLEKRGVCRKTDILNGNTIRDASGKALSVKQLKRNRDDRWIQHNRDRNYEYNQTERW